MACSMNAVVRLQVSGSMKWGHLNNIHLHSCKHKTVKLKLLTLTDTGGAVLTLMIWYRRLRNYKLKRKIQIWDCGNIRGVYYPPPVSVRVRVRVSFSFCWNWLIGLVNPYRHCITCTGTGFASRILHVSPSMCNRTIFTRCKGQLLC